MFHRMGLKAQALPNSLGLSPGSVTQQLGDLWDTPASPRAWDSLSKQGSSWSGHQLPQVSLLIMVSEQ